MILRVSDTLPRDEVNMNEVCISTSEFADIRRHPFIATQRFDAIVVDLCKTIPVGYLQATMQSARIIPKIRGEIDTDVVRLLAELYPDKAAELRYTFIRNKQRLKEIVEELSEQYDWKHYY